MNDPTFSVIVPTYNCESLLPRALDSVADQTVDDWEIVLVNDGSTDGTADVAARYARRLQDRFIYIHQPNHGCSHARNRGIDVCRGRFVAFLDSDDEYQPTKLERQLRLFDLRPELGLVARQWVRCPIPHGPKGPLRDGCAPLVCVQGGSV